MAVTPQTGRFRSRHRAHLRCPPDPPGLAEGHAKRTAGIAERPEIIGDWPLTLDQAAAIADIIHRRIDLDGVDYFLEL